MLAQGKARKLLQYLGQGTHHLLQHLWRGTPQDRAFRFAIVAFVLFGMGLRLVGYLGEPLGE